ncbi:MAG TPA: PIN domain-containing protein [Candidatus Limnocylindrales bacterium]|nr:PIN domain-containing protein [Candidatus Limnocylindrales bacterium]
MSAEFFLDTNVLIYAFTEQDAPKRIRSRELYELAIGGRGIISFQVVQEFLNTAQKKFSTQFTDADLREFLNNELWPLCAVFPSAELYDHALRLRVETGYSFYDSLIVAAALEAGCKTIYSEDLQHNRKLHGLEIKNPF